MRVGMMQPYFFPYLGYFGVIHASERWVVFDSPQYIRRGWVNRNRILSDNSNGWKYVRVPIMSSPVETPIRGIRIANGQDWRQELFNSLQIYRQRKAPCYQRIVDFLQETLSFKTDRLCELLVHCLAECCELLGISFRSISFSSMNVDCSQISQPGEWALVTSQALGAHEYVNPPGGREIFDVDKFQQASIKLNFLQPTLPSYDQGQEAFQPGLSVIDALMWNHPTAVRDMIADYQLVSPSRTAA